MRKRRKVFCSGCANLLYIPGLPPQCVATAEFVSGPLRPRINVVGRVPAEKRNRYNDCQYRESVSVRAYRLKRWILWRANNEGRWRSVKEENLKEYSVAVEDERAKAYREKDGEVIEYSERDEGEPDEIDSAEVERIQSLASQIRDAEGYSEETDEDAGNEDVLADGDDGSDDKPGTGD